MPATQSYTVTHVGISTARLALQAQGSAKNQTWFGRRRALPMRIKKHVECKTRTPLASPRAKAEFAAPEVRAAVSAQVRPTPQQVKRFVKKQAKGSAESRLRRAVQVHLSPCAEHSQSSVTSSPRSAAATWLYIFFESTQHKHDAGAGLCITLAQAKSSAFLCT